MDPAGLLEYSVVFTDRSLNHMSARFVDVLLSAPQKGWSGTPGAGHVILSEAGRDAIASAQSTSFAIDFGKWLSIADEYRAGRAVYHATMPTDSIVRNLGTMIETRDRGYEEMRAAQIELDARVRELLPSFGYRSDCSGSTNSPTSTARSHDCAPRWKRSSTDAVVVCAHGSAGRGIRRHHRR